MNLTLHQIRKDVRQFRVILGVWFLMLGLDLATNLGWLDGGMGNNWRQDGLSPGIIIMGLQALFLWPLFILIVSAVVLADSPGRREGFLRTRPLPGGSLFAAKALFVLGLLLLPWLLQDLIYLAVSGWSAGNVLHGVGDLLLWLLPMAVIAAAFASLWRSYSQWVRGAVIACGGAIAILLLIELFLRLAGHSDARLGSSASPASRAVAGVYAFSLAALAVAVGQARCVWGACARWLGIASAIAIYVWVSTSWPWDLFVLRPADPAAAQAAVNQSPLNVSLQQIQLTPLFGKQWDDRLDFRVDVTPKSNRSVFPQIIEWRCQAGSLVNAVGEDFPLTQVPPGNLFGVNSQPDDWRIWAGLLPKEAMLRLSRNRYVWEPTTLLGEFKPDRHAPWLRDPATLQARMEGRVYRWDKVAEFALDRPATVTAANGAWTFLASHRDYGRQQSHLRLKRSQVAFSTATDPRTTDFQYGPEERYGFVLYNSRHNVALLPDNGVTEVSRGRQTALAQFWLDLMVSDDSYGDNSMPLSAEEIRQSRLLIFEKIWLGTVPAHWQSPGLVISERMSAQAVAPPDDRRGGLSRNEEHRRLAELPVPGPQAARAEVCRYLLQAVPILDNLHPDQCPDEAAITQLAALVPEHLAVLLEGLPAMEGPAKTCVIQAIRRGAGESQRTQIGAALQNNPDLIEVLVQRGWLAGSRDDLYKLLDAPKPLTLATLRAVASQADPATYPRLLKEFEAQPREEVYDLLHPLPGLAGPLDASVARLWQNHEPFLFAGLRDFQTLLTLALHAGNRDALQFAYRLLGDLRSSKDGGMDQNALAQTFRETVKLDGVSSGEETNDQRVLDWMRQHEPDAFVFDPVRQRFVLKP